jgi:hypothetical protein
MINMQIFPPDIVAPEKVRGLRAEFVRKRKGLYDVAFGWKKPTLQPDNYTLQLDSLRSEGRLLIVPGVSIAFAFDETT